MNKWAELLLGMILLIGMIWAAWASSVYDWAMFGKSLNLLHAGWIFLLGGIFWLVILIGLILIMLGINDLKE